MQQRLILYPVSLLNSFISYSSFYGLLLLQVVALWRRGSVVSFSKMSPGHQNLEFQKCLLCELCVPYCCGWAVFVSGQLSAMAHFPCCWQFGPSVVNGQMWGCPELEWGQLGICQSCSSTKLQGILPVLYQGVGDGCGGDFHRWVKCVVRPDVCPQPTARAAI